MNLLSDRHHTNPGLQMEGKENMPMQNQKVEKALLGRAKRVLVRQKGGSCSAMQARRVVSKLGVHSGCETPSGRIMSTPVKTLNLNPSDMGSDLFRTPRKSLFQATLATHCCPSPLEPGTPRVQIPPADENFDPCPNSTPGIKKQDFCTTPSLLLRHTPLAKGSLGPPRRVPVTSNATSPASRHSIVQASSVQKLVLPPSTPKSRLSLQPDNGALGFENSHSRALRTHLQPIQEKAPLRIFTPSRVLNKETKDTQVKTSKRSENSKMKCKSGKKDGHEALDGGFSPTRKKLEGLL